jgi:hypothetical protein
MIDQDEHKQVNGNRLLRLIGIANEIARFLNVEAHAKKAFVWLTQTIKDGMFFVWKTISNEVVLVSKAVQRVLGFGAGEEPPADSIVLVPVYADTLVLPVY